MSIDSPGGSSRTENSFPLAEFYDAKDFIFSHFSKFVFPRTISTHKTKSKQFEVFSREQIMLAFEEAKFIDCRVNAYPS